MEFGESEAGRTGLQGPLGPTGSFLGSVSPALPAPLHPLSARMLGLGSQPQSILYKHHWIGLKIDHLLNHKKISTLKISIKLTTSSHCQDFD